MNNVVTTESGDQLEDFSSWTPHASKQMVEVKEFKEKLALEKAEKEKNKPETNQSNQLLDMLQDDIYVKFFQDELGNPCVNLRIDDHMETWKTNSKNFKRWLSKLYYDTYGKTINQDALKNALHVVEGNACFDGNKYELANRVGWRGDELWYDMADPEWTAVKINKTGWDIMKEPPILFRRFSHQQAQIKPIGGGDIRKVLNLVNINNRDQEILFLVFLVSCFIPGFPHAILYIYGPQGSAKSTFSKIVKKLADPSLIETSSFPKNKMELTQVLSHHQVIFFDNVSGISEEVSDTLCMAVSGKGFSKRELYTDDEDIIYTFKRTLGINGINLMATKPDLLERSILLELQRVPKDKRRQEEDIVKEFEDSRSEILGAIFDVIVKALQIKPTVKVARFPRMADFAGWGCAISEAMGYTQKEFMDAYNQNIESQTMEILYENTIASLIMELMQQNDRWTGTATKLLEDLKFIASEDVKHGLPKAPNVLSRELNLIKPNLEEAGIKLHREEDGIQRQIILERVIARNPQPDQLILAEENYDTDDIFPDLTDSSINN